MKGLITGLLFLLAFGSADASRLHRKGDTIKVQVKHEKSFPKSKLSVKFVEMVEDSRCPVDTQCIWAGNAKIKIRVSKNGRSHDLTLDTNGPNETVTAEGYSLKLVELTPSPRSNIRVNRNGYVATIEAEKLHR